MIDVGEQVGEIIFKDHNGTQKSLNTPRRKVVFCKREEILSSSWNNYYKFSLFRQTYINYSFIPFSIFTVINLNIFK